jgi:ATP-binding cassette, subfamily C (CFTR/MRP), member 4
MPFYKGKFSIEGKISYVEQEPFIFSDSLKKNILMGKEFNKDLYENVVEVCQLRRDIEEMADGEDQEIGEKGINLSGGQKARIALARALYQDFDLYLLDDPLSAVDSRVARLIY